MENKKQTIGEEIANAISHGLMVPFSVIIFIIYYRLLKNKADILPLFFFITTMFNLYLVSCLYHSLSFTKAKYFLQRLDHICIYLLIWGSFLPFLFLSEEFQKPSFWINSITKGQFFFLLQTVIVFLGILFKIFWMHKGNKIHLCLYLLLGWSAIFICKSLWPLWEINYKILIFLFLGGLFYSFGIIFYSNFSQKYHHFFWHLCVILGNLLHVGAVYYLLKK